MAGQAWTLLWTLVPASLVVAFLLYKVSWGRYKLPPGPHPRPFVGNLLDVTSVRFKCFEQWAKSYGPVMSVWMGSTLNVVVSSAEAAKEVLKDKDLSLAARARSRAAAKFSRDGQDLIWADYGPHYVKVRKVCNLELFTPKRLEALRPIREDEVTAMAHKIHRDASKGPLNPKKYLTAVAFNNITRLAFGKRFVDDDGNVNSQGVEFKEVIGHGMKLGASLKISEHIPSIRWMFPLQNEEFAKQGARRDALTRTIMQDHSELREKHGAQQHFVDALLSLQKQYDLSEMTIIGLLWDMVTAGMDTVAITVEWALAELIKNPAVQKKAQEELDAVIGNDRVLTEADFSRLPYLTALTKESLRLHPPTPLMLPHKCTEHVKIQGYDIPKGTVVHCNIYVIARDPAIWKEPLAFRPERFIEQDVDIKGHDFRLLPFGAGRRVCPGAQLGLNMVQLMIGRLLHQFSWSPPQGVKPEDISLEERSGIVTYMAKSLEAIATPRLRDALYARDI